MKCAWRDWTIAGVLLAMAPAMHARAQDEDAGTNPQDALLAPLPVVEPPQEPATLAESPVEPSLQTPVEPSLQTPSEPTLPFPSEVAPIDVIVRAASKAKQRNESAESVKVIETEQARRESADLGAVLARVQGVSVRRAGALGSTTRLSLNGLTDDQIRMFIDGVPLELAGYPFGISNVPVTMLERIEIYSGVVPVRFGADALGGAINLVSDDEVRGKKMTASYQLGSFETQRLALSGRYRHGPSGLFVRAAAFYDDARNDYPIDVQVPNEQGQLSDVKVRRFHDGYRARGANVEAGFVQRPWAKRLLLRAFVTDYDKQLQSNYTMTVPYGAASYGERSAGSSLRYQVDLTSQLGLEATAGYTYTRGQFLDLTSCVYDRYGRCTRQRTQPGETDKRPHDSMNWAQSGFARVHLTYRPAQGHSVRLTAAPTYYARTGQERAQLDPSLRDPLGAEHHLLTWVNGLEYQSDLFEDRLQTIVFAKQYVQLLKSEEPTTASTFRRRDRTTQRFGFGASTRMRIVDVLYAKASYELATRLPSPNEVFGNNIFVVANLELRPETSHNVNVGFTVDAPERAGGSYRATVNGFLRDADHLIVLLGNNLAQQYENVYSARSKGIEGALGWTSVRDYLALDGNTTYIDFRNTSHAGTFGGFTGDRIPNRPYFLANASARSTLHDVLTANDELSLSWSLRYTHSFYRSWESIGLRDTKQVIPTQTVHSVVLSYLLRGEHSNLGTTFEVQNLTDQRVYDYFGVQRPGRAFYLKSNAEF